MRWVKWSVEFVKIIFQTKIYLNTSLSLLTVHELRLSPKDDQKQLQRLRRLEHMSHHTTSSLVILSFNNRFLNLHWYSDRQVLWLITILVIHQLNSSLCWAPFYGSSFALMSHHRSFFDYKSSTKTLQRILLLFVHQW